MMTPPKGDYAQVPMNAAARKVADTFDPALYGGANYQTSQIIDCRAYGGAGLMHMPMRLRITWDSPDTLKIETDWGQQTRLLHFTPGQPFGDIEVAFRTGEVVASRGPASMQGYSVAAWQQPFRSTRRTINAPTWGAEAAWARTGQANCRLVATWRWSPLISRLAGCAVTGRPTARGLAWLSTS